MLTALCFALLLQNGVSAERDQLTQGVGELVIPGGVPGAMVATGSPSFVVLTGNGREPVIVATHIGKGRALGVGHGAFFGGKNLENESNRRLLLNSLAWLGKKPLNQLSVGLIQSDIPPAFLKREGVKPVTDALDHLNELQILCLSQGAFDGDQSAQERVRQFMRDGGGVLISGPAWGWVQLSKGKSLKRDHTGNRLLMDYGIGFTAATADGPFSPRGAENPSLTTYGAMETLRDSPSQQDAEIAVSSIQSAILTLPDLDADLRKEILARAEREGNGKPMPTLQNPITWKTPFSRIRVALEANRYEGAAPGAVRKDPAADDFPGAVPKGAKRVSRRVDVDAGVSGRHGVGAYAAPGEVITVRIPTSATGLGLGLRIGAQKDTLWGSETWARHPQITQETNLSQPVTEIASPFGGLIYVTAPQGKSGVVSVELANVVAAPQFVLGKSTKTDWAISSANPAPWADLEGRSIALTLPSSVVANLKDPTALMNYWDDVARYCCELYAEPKPSRPERYCVDRQISNGYMHSGYPIMTHEDVAATFADVAKLRSKAGPVWGFYHELGHNYQKPEWTWDGCGEVTNNLFALYGNEMLNGITPETYGLAHPALKKDEVRDRLARYLHDGAPYDRWRSEPFLALTMYVQLRTAFGWEPFKKVFAEYRSLSRSERPKSDEEKRDQWMVRFSHAVRKNLGPFFVAWGVPTSAAARKSIEDLPDWMPADWPTN